MTEIGHGTIARGWRSDDGSLTPLGVNALAGVWELCPDLYVSFKQARDNALG